MFIEVKARTSAAFGPPQEAVTYAKRQKLIMVAEHYIQNQAPDARQWRIDVVAVEMDSRGKARHIEVIQNAVGFEE